MGQPVRGIFRVRFRECGTRVLSRRVRAEPEQSCDGLARQPDKPSRGILVFVPTYLLLALLLAKYRRRIPYNPLAIMALTRIGCRVMIVSSWPMWWGGHCFGPPLLAPPVPWTFLLAVLAIRPCPARHLPRIVMIGLPVIALAVRMESHLGALERRAKLCTGIGYDHFRGKSR